MKPGPQHVAVVAAEVAEMPEASRPTPGPIAVLPLSREVFVDAVRAGGGVVEELSDSTRGVVWLSTSDTSELVSVLDAHPSIEWVQLPWAGVDAFAHILRDAAGSPKPLWTSAKGAYSQPVAEHALMLMLALLREIPRCVTASSWASEPVGRSLFGLEVLIIGAGGIALELIRLLEVFGVTVTVVRRNAGQLSRANRTVTVDQLHAVLPDAAVVVIAAALTDSTSGLIGTEEFALMRSDAVLVNIARGALVDSAALLECLRAGRIAGAGLDVTDPEPLPDGHPLWSEPRVIITSHNADTPDMTAPLLAERVRQNVEAFLGHGRFVGVVDPVAGY